MSETISISVILFILLSLLLTISAYELKKILKISVAPIILILGFFFRLLGEITSNFNRVIEIVNTLDPNLITLAIMPALLYETSMRADWFTFRRQLGQILPMATSVVGLSAFLTAAAFKYVLGYDFTWMEGLLLGVILNATDHVAVTAQLKDIYADEKFEMLIGGETLLNEATVMVLFSVMLKNNENTLSVAGNFAYFLRLSLGGFALGLGFAVAMGEILQRIVNDYIQETLLTVITTYLLFYTANSAEVEVSGAIAVVTLGLYMSAYGKTLVSAIVEKPMHFSWSIIATNIESFVFILGGMILGDLVTNTENLVASDIAMLFSMFLILHLVRFLVILLHYPLLKYFGYGVSWKEIIVLTFAGIKGVISLAIALIAFHDPNISQSFASIMLFFAVGIASLTIVLDSLAVKVLVKLFKLEDLSDAQESTLVGVSTAILQETAKNIERLRSDKEFDLVKWKEVLDVIGSKRLLHGIMKSNRIGSQVLKEHKETKSPEEILKIYSEKFELSKGDLELETRARFYSTLKAIYWHEFESGQCNGYTSLVLINSCNIAQETTASQMNDWEVLEKLLTTPKITNILERLSHIPIIGGIFKKMVYTKVMIKYDAASTFIKSHEEAIELMDKMEIDTNERIFEEIVSESHQQIHLCSEYVKHYITDLYPGIISQVQSNIAARTLLISQRKLINKIYSQGVIKDLEYECLQDAIDENIKSLMNNSSVQQSSLKEILKNKFKQSNSKAISDLLPHIQEKQYKPEEVIFTEGGPVEGGYLIFSGRVREYSGWIDQELRVGNILGAQHLLPQYSYTNTTTAVASTVVQAVLIPKALLSDKIYLEDLYKEASEELILLNRGKLKLVDVKFEHIVRVIKSSTIEFFEAGNTVSLNRGGLLLYGRIKKREEAVMFIRPKNEAVDCYEDCVFMTFPQHLAAFFKQFKKLALAFEHFYVRSAARKASTRIYREENAEITMNKFHRD